MMKLLIAVIFALALSSASVLAATAGSATTPGANPAAPGETPETAPGNINNGSDMTRSGSVNHNQQPGTVGSTTHNGMNQPGSIGNPPATNAPNAQPSLTP